MNRLLLICLESKNPKTEKNFFKSIVDKNKELIEIQYLDQEKSDASCLSNINIMKLKKMINKDNNANCEIICFCDGDIDENQLKSINNTYDLIIKFYEFKKNNILSKELLYDEGHSFEFFIWHITNKYDPIFLNSNRHDIKSIKVRYIKDLVEIFRNYDDKIKNINDVKKKSIIIWKPIVDYWLSPNSNNKDHIQITKNILKKFNNKDVQNSKYFRILEQIIKRYEFIENTYLYPNKNNDIDN